jgi:hypothetical protein
LVALQLGSADSRARSQNSAFRFGKLLAEQSAEQSSAESASIPRAEDLFLALEASIEDHIALEMCVGDFDRDGVAVESINRLENRRHSVVAAHDQAIVLQQRRRDPIDRGN